METNAEQTAKKQIADVLARLDPRLRTAVVKHIQTGEQSFFEHLSDRAGDLATKKGAMQVIMGVLRHLDPTTRNRLMASIYTDKPEGGHGTT